MTKRRHFFIEGKYIASIDTIQEDNFGKLVYFQEPSLHFFCEECGRVWATAIMYPEENNHLVIEDLCKRHGGGSMYKAMKAWHNDHFCSALPLPILIHDFMLLSKEAA